SVWLSLAAGTLTVQVATRHVWTGPELVIIGGARMLRWPNKFVIITASKTYSTLVGGQITLTWRTSIGTIKCGTITTGIIGGNRLLGPSRLRGSPGGGVRRFPTITRTIRVTTTTLCT